MSDQQGDGRGASRSKAARLGGIAVAMALVAGCGQRTAIGQYNDPGEPGNRAMHAVNTGLDAAFVRPGSKGYGTLVPEPIRHGIANVADTISLPGVIANEILQGRIGDAATNTLRFGANLTFGLGGLFDFASAAGMPKRTTDFGTTLAVWGVGEGPYVELPVFGPSTTRDAVGIAVDLAFNPMYHVFHGKDRRAVIAAQILSKMNDRYRFADTIDSILYESEDSYAQSRQLYLQNRRFEIGKATGNGNDDDFIDPYGDIDDE